MPRSKFLVRMGKFPVRSSAERTRLWCYAMQRISSPFLSLAALGVLSVCMARTDEKLLMQAVVAHEYGAPDVLKLEQLPRPEPNDDEALVRVIASSVNPADPLTLNGKYAKEFGTHLPLIPGYDIAGVVQKIGANIRKLKVGDFTVTQLSAVDGRSSSRSRNGK
ncbi:MAG: hypothetical protein DME53_00095 [Verrucomicrobia bacterium]|nr:MAG: hypothetical protein DME53_00095 [Verrucomicrobiota bacterium]